MLKQRERGSAVKTTPLLLEVRTASPLPSMVQNVASTHQSQSVIYKMHEVVSLLKSHGVHDLYSQALHVPDSSPAEEGSADKVWQWIQKEQQQHDNRPAIVLYHEESTGASGENEVRLNAGDIPRSLAGSASSHSSSSSGSAKIQAHNSGVSSTPPTMFEIAQYQIVFWTVIGTCGGSSTCCSRPRSGCSPRLLKSRKPKTHLHAFYYFF